MPPPANKVPKHVCHVCAAGFHRHSHLERHTKTHLSYKEYTCDACGRDFVRRDNLMRHRRMFHPSEIFDDSRKIDCELSPTSTSCSPRLRTSNGSDLILSTPPVSPQLPSRFYDESITQYGSPRLSPISSGSCYPPSVKQEDDSAAHSIPTPPVEFEPLWNRPTGQFEGEPRPSELFHHFSHPSFKLPLSEGSFFPSRILPVPWHDSEPRCNNVTTLPPFEFPPIRELSISPDADILPVLEPTVV
ncbi:hypothetical protein M427DRAFT_57504 [Gonapodya prolifera JEL478]|uniref:C2H2-type domain-containing protein n=1 Tax=Gonapodya prolifera (strain JEL478) TaxID=1344416 RepID=A0A139ACR7_GONPJ|nr:hypothetical protein M427DRAFT_57504 [Gonapodya prolifera JEL478]|eukprot:KXS14602.1 hypothetical protein M427DRAFT_57504 [Gonapodya prolifera JEL478]